MSSLSIQPRPVTIQPRPVTHALVPQEPDEKTKRKLSILDPKLFANVWLQTDIWDTQAQILDAIANEDRVVVKACHASSKTFTAAIVTLWFLARYDEAIVITTAPTWVQVEKLLWGEVHSALLRSRYPFPKANLTELKLGPKRYASGLSTAVTKQDEGVKFQGYHAKNLLFILDEAPGVNPKIWEAIEGGRAGGNVKVLAIGNPTITSGPFHRAFVEGRDGWKPFTIDAFNTPNLRDITVRAEDGSIDTEQSIKKLLSLTDDELKTNPLEYLVTKKWVKEQYLEWGVDHPFWEARVRGAFPKQSQDSLLSLNWLEQAKIRELPLGDECTAGLDVAGPGEDETSLTIRKGPVIVFHKQWPQEDPRGEIVRALNEYKSILKAVNVDIIGQGYYLGKHLQDLGFPTVSINVCETSNDTEKFDSLKSEYYWGLRMRCQAGDISGLMDEKTIGQLAGIKWKSNSRGQIEIESKEDARKRGVHSPDRAESIMLAFAKNIRTYGVLDWAKELMTHQKVELPKVNVATTSESNTCPQCQAVCIVPCNGGSRCNQCGHQWVKADDKKKIEEKQKTSRQVLSRSSFFSNKRLFNA